MKTNTIKNIVILVAMSLCLAGCEEKAFTIYLFGLANSCFSSPAKGKCNDLKIYDRVSISVSNERQEVNLIREGVGLDKDNVVYDKISGCKIIDKNNFSCDKLSFLDGRIVDSSFFKDLTPTKSYVGYLFSYWGGPVSVSSLDFLTRNDSWVTTAMVVVVILMVLGLIGNS